MYMENDNREFEVKAQLEKERENIKTFDDLVSFLERVKNTGNTGYGTAPRAIAQAALATAWYLASDFGITGFQGVCTMWDFIRDWEFPCNECGMKIVDYDNMLYPQYDYKFEKTIPARTFESLQKTAKKKLEEHNGCVHPAVAAHWRSIVDGCVPFGYVVRDD